LITEPIESLDGMDNFDDLNLRMNQTITDFTNQNLGDDFQMVPNLAT
jgi:hypothetical protein